MNRGLISTRYAKALLQIGQEQGNLQHFLYDNATKFYNALNDTAEFDVFIKNPIIKDAQKKSMVRSVFGKMFNETMLNFIEIIIENRREMLINDIFRNFLYLYRQQQGIKSVTVVTSISIDDNYKNQIRKILEKKLDAEIELECKVDADIIGGLIIIIDDKQADGSIAGELRELKKKMIH
ncbi:MAG: ATP synthase F1 subunit delta [Marinilabiliaceae bacterium]|nr:ATP synthase F1 subunit delta [Marinilabiliaceae bacterium]